MRKNAGFSLMEVMTVLGILAILSAIAIPGYLGWRDNARLASAAQDVYSIFQKAKIEAARRNATVAITFAANIATVYVDSNGNFAQDGGENVINSIDLSDYPGINLDASEGGGDGITFANPDDTIAFAPNGFPLDNTGSLTSGTVFLINRKNAKASIRISPAGNVGINRTG
jgi:type IV fimbrial biogenesis protein FimT